ncbi:MAG: DNA sulfur modification protein DndE [Acidobacteria bacterium]|nr:DNA sulfur modification protein DndE [Acidobacteriota bacterium]
MRFTKIRLTKDASNRLRFLAGRTGLTPNLLCRLGFCLSLEEPKVPNPDEFAEEEREFNRYTLLGEYDSLYIALLRQRLHQDGLEEANLEGHFRAHLNRGISLLQQRVRNVADLATLVPNGKHVVAGKPKR